MTPVFQTTYPTLSDLTNGQRPELTDLNSANETNVGAVQIVLCRVTSSAEPDIHKLIRLNNRDMIVDYDFNTQYGQYQINQITQ